MNFAKKISEFQDLNVWNNEEKDFRIMRMKKNAIKNPLQHILNLRVMFYGSGLRTVDPVDYIKLVASLIHLAEKD